MWQTASSETLKPSSHVETSKGQKSGGPGSWSEASFSLFLLFLKTWRWVCFMQIVERSSRLSWRFLSSVCPGWTGRRWPTARWCSTAWKTSRGSGVVHTGAGEGVTGVLVYLQLVDLDSTVFIIKKNQLFRAFRGIIMLIPHKKHSKRYFDPFIHLWEPAPSNPWEQAHKNNILIK